MGSQDGGEGVSARTGVTLARSRGAANWETLCQAAPWGQGKDASTSPLEPAASSVTQAVLPVAVVAPSPAVTPEFDPPQVVHHSLLEAFDAWSQLEGATPALAATALPSAPTTAQPAAFKPAETAMSGGEASFLAWVEAEGGLSAAGSSDLAARRYQAPVEAVSAREPASLPEPIGQPPAPSSSVAEFAPVLVSVSIESALVEKAAEPAPVEIAHPAPAAEAAVEVSAPRLEPVARPVPIVKAFVDAPVWRPESVTAPPKKASRNAMDAATMEALAAEMAPMKTRPVPLGVSALSKAPPLAKAKLKPKAQARLSTAGPALATSLFAAVKNAAEQAIKGVGLAAGKKPKRSAAPPPPPAKPATVKAHSVGRAPAGKVPVRTKPAVQRVLGVVEREVGIAFGALKSVGSGLIRQAQSVIVPKPRSKRKPTQRPVPAARGR